MVPSRERLLINTETLDGLSLTAHQTALDGSFLNGMHLVPAQLQLIGDGFLTGCLEPIDGQSFKQRCEPTGGLGPRKLYDTNAMLRAVAARRFGMQDRLALTRVQMPPTAFLLMIIERAGLAALRTRPLYSRPMDQMNVNFSIRQFQLDAINAPRGSNPQDLGIQFLVLHLTIMPLPTKIPDGPKSWWANIRRSCCS